MNTFSTFGEPCGDVDQLLSAYFRAQLPQPWPALPPAPPRGAPAQRRWSRQLLAAASLLLGLAGYLGLARLFPPSPVMPAPPLPGVHVGEKPRTPAPPLPSRPGRGLPLPPAGARP